MAALAAFHSLLQVANRARKAASIELLLHQHRAGFDGMAAFIAGDPQIIASAAEVIDRIERKAHSAPVERNGNIGQPSRRPPIQLWRVRCGRKVWSPWLPSEDDALWRAHHLKLARYDWDRRRFFPGPLTWIECGQRAYAGRRTVPLRRDADGQPLSELYQPTMPLG